MHGCLNFCPLSQIDLLKNRPRKIYVGGNIINAENFQPRKIPGSQFGCRFSKDMAQADGQYGQEKLAAQWHCLSFWYIIAE